MLTTVFLTLSFAFQGQPAVPTTDPFQLLQMYYEQEMKQEATRRALDKQNDQLLEHKFEMRFNDVANALAEFGKSFDQSHKIDAEKAERLNKAWRDLEKVDHWFDTTADR